MATPTDSNTETQVGVVLENGWFIAGGRGELEGGVGVGFDHLIL